MAIVLAALAGVFGVLQGGINRHIAHHWGFSSALLYNGIIFLVFNIFLCALVYYKPGMVPASYRVQGALSDAQWWWALSGLFGFLLVASIATAIGHIGSLQAFVFCVAAQLVASNLWDYFMENKDFSVSRLLGTAITFVGVWVASRP